MCSVSDKVGMTRDHYTARTAASIKSSDVIQPDLRLRNVRDAKTTPFMQGGSDPAFVLSS
jgi:hypothetical protein